MSEIAALLIAKAKRWRDMADELTLLNMHRDATQYYMREKACLEAAKIVEKLDDADIGMDGN